MDVLVLLLTIGRWWDFLAPITSWANSLTSLPKNLSAYMLFAVFVRMTQMDTPTSQKASQSCSLCFYYQSQWSCFPVNTQELAHLDFPCNLLPVKLAPARQPCLLPVATGPLLTQHGYTRLLHCQMSYSKHRNVIHLPWQIPRPSLLSSSKLDSQMHCSPSHARREAMMGLFLPRTMARVWFGFF